MKKKNIKKTLTPKQILFVKHWYSPESETYNNAYRSAIKAGYSPKTAVCILSNSTQWLETAIQEITRTKVNPTDNTPTKSELVKEAKKVLRKSLKSKDEKLAQDTAKFIAKTDIEFSEKHEIKHELPAPIFGGKSNEIQADDSN